MNNDILKAAQMLVDSEKIAIAGLTVKLRKITEMHPYDQTLVSMHNIVSKFDDNNRTFISRGELKNLYNKLWSRGTKFADFFKEEMGEVNNLIGPKYAEKQEKPIDNKKKTYADPILTNALENAFDKRIPLKLYSQELGKQALLSVGSNLDAWNLRASKLEVDSGNEQFLLIKAHYDTPKGITSIFIPIEIMANKISQPSFFIGNTGSKELNNTNIKTYLTQNAGVKLNVNSSDIMTLLNNVANSKTKKISSVELAVIRVNASKQVESPFFSDTVIGQTMHETPKNVRVSLPQSGNFNSFAEKFASPLGFANLKFGVDKVNLGRDTIVQALANLNIKNTQIVVADADEKTIVYAVNLSGNQAFHVPIKFANNRILTPEVLICNNETLPFNKQSINQLASKNQFDQRAAAATSPSYNLKPSELIELVRQATIEGNLSKAEDALNVLSQNQDDKAYKIAFSVYMDGLSISKKASKEEPTCSMIVQSSSSKHPICGHTGLPVHKVFQDQHGNCLPLYRKGMKETSNNSAYIMNTKIFG